MTKFNKSILASAIAASALVAGAASAATLGYETVSQITYAKDLIATDSRTIDLPAGYIVKAVSSTETTNAGAVLNGDVVEIVVSLGQGANAARFQSAAPTMTEAALKNSIIIGTQLGGDGTLLNSALGAIDANATITYSQGEREMRIRFETNADGSTAAAAGDWSVKLPSLRVYDLQGALYNNSIINGGISITNIDQTDQILAGNAVLARSAWGESFATDLPNINKWIDVARCSDTQAPRTRFSQPIADRAVSVGTSCGYAQNGWFNAGQVDLFLTEADHVGLSGAANTTVVNNFDGATSWGLSATNIVFKVEGTNLSAFNNGNLWLDLGNGAHDCSKVANEFIPLTVAADGLSATASHKLDAPANANLAARFLGLTDGTATESSPVSLNVCFAANGSATLVPQNLSASVAYQHGVPALFVDPDAFTDNLFPLRDNVGTFIFQNVNPAGTPSAQSFLRLTNNTSQTCAVTIDAKDDAGKLSGEVKYTLAAHASEQFNSAVLETGVDNQGRAITGKFGDGTGKWYVRVQPECANFNASALNRNQTDGTVTDLTPERNEGAWLTPTELLNP